MYTSPHARRRTAGTPRFHQFAPAALGEQSPMAARSSKPRFHTVGPFARIDRRKLRLPGEYATSRALSGSSTGTNSRGATCAPWLSRQLRSKTQDSSAPRPRLPTFAKKPDSTLPSRPSHQPGKSTWSTVETARAGSCDCQARSRLSHGPIQSAQQAALALGANVSRVSEKSTRTARGRFPRSSTCRSKK